MDIFVRYLMVILVLLDLNASRRHFILHYENIPIQVY